MEKPNSVESQPAEPMPEALTTQPDETQAELEREPPEEPTPEDEIREAVLADVKEYFGVPAESEATAAAKGPFATPTSEFLETSFFDFSYLDGRQEVERYWVNEPFAYISILYDEERRTYFYHMSEPKLDDFEQYVRQELIRAVRNSLMYRDLGDERENRREIFEAEVHSLIEEHAATVDAGSIRKLQYYLIRDFVDYGRIDPVMRDENIEDISCDGVDVPVFVYHRSYRDLRTNASFDSKNLNSLVVRLAQQAGKHLSVSDPLVDASLPNGSRIQLTLGGDIATRGSNFTIRKFSDVPFTPVDLINWNTFSLDEMAYLWLCIENNRSLVFAGGTGSGKTTSLNAVSFFIPPDAKVVSIEDTREVTLPHENWVQSLSRSAVGQTGRGEIGTNELLQAALRQRPEYLLVGEIRTEQRVAQTFFQAISTGHTCYTTIHADSVDGAISRLQNPPLSVPVQMLEELDILSVQKQVFVEEDRIRRNQTLTEIESEDDEIAPHAVFERDARTDTHKQVAESKVLQKVAEMRGWSDAELEDELAERKRILEYLIEEDVSDYREVAAVIHTFQRNPEYVTSRIEGGDLEPSALVGEQR